MTRYTSSVVLALAAVATNFHSTQAAVCGTYEVDFGSFARGEYLTTQLKADYGIEVRCSSDEGYGCRIFDTAVAWGEWESGSGCACKMENCSDQKKKDCGDTDLAAPNAACPGGGMGEGEDGGPDAEYPNCEPRGNVLIIDENGPSKPPDDSVNGGKMRFLFDYPTDLDEVCFLDVDGEEQTWLSVSAQSSGFFTEVHATPFLTLLIPWFWVYRCTSRMIATLCSTFQFPRSEMVDTDVSPSLISELANLSSKWMAPVPFRI